METKLKTLATALHLLTCRKIHEESMEEILNRDKDKCYFYLEETIEKTWNQEDHLRYFEKAVLVSDTVNPKDPQEAISVLRGLLDSIYLISGTVQRYPGLKPIILKMFPRNLIP